MIISYDFFSIQMQWISWRLNFFYGSTGSFVCFWQAQGFSSSDVQRAWAHLSVDHHHRNSLIMKTNYVQAIQLIIIDIISNRCEQALVSNGNFQ